MWLSPRDIDHLFSEVHFDTLMTSFQNVLGIEHSQNSNVREVSAAIFTWALRGFCGPEDGIARIFQTMCAILLAWTMPLRMKHGRNKQDAWKLLVSLAIIIGLFDMHKKASKRSHLRVMLRGFSKSAQSAFLLHDYNNKPWKLFVHTLFTSVWQCRTLPSKLNACVYMMWGQPQRAFYIGKTNAERQYGQSGVVCRYREHMVNTYRPVDCSRPPKRYQTWKCNMMHHMQFAHCFWAREGRVLRYERQIIHALQAPIQDREKVDAFHPYRARPWPRQRNKWSVEHEIELNESCKKEKQLKLHEKAGVPVGISSFQQLCEWQRLKYNRSVDCVIDMAYSCKRVLWLLVVGCWLLLLLFFFFSSLFFSLPVLWSTTPSRP